MCVELWLEVVEATDLVWSGEEEGDLSSSVGFQWLPRSVCGGGIRNGYTHKRALGNVSNVTTQHTHQRSQRNEDNVHLRIDSSRKIPINVQAEVDGTADNLARDAETKPYAKEHAHAEFFRICHSHGFTLSALSLPTPSGLDSPASMAQNSPAERPHSAAPKSTNHLVP